MADDKTGYRHPSGPSLPGHPACGPGMIYDHNTRRCISVSAKRSKRNSKHDVGWEPEYWEPPKE